MNISPYIFKGNPRQSGILDSTPWVPNSKYLIVDSLSVEPEFRIPIVSGIPDSLSGIQDSKAQNFGFHDSISWIPDPQKFPRFRNLDSFTWG